MKNALRHWTTIRKKLIGRNTFLFCDFDGTLTPIRPRPGLAILGLSQRKFLESLTRVSGIKLAFVSGRGLADLKEKVPVSGAFYSGNHGLEASGPGFEFLAPLPEGWKETLSSLKQSVSVLQETFPGLLIEDKGLTLSLHYRNVSASRQSDCGEAIIFCISPWIKSGEAKIHSGKKVIEIRPPMVWHKGSIVQEFLRHNGQAKAVAIFIGDDVTDEDAFRTVGAKGVSIHVGKNRETAAQYHLNGVPDVYRFLTKIKEDKKHDS